MKTSPTITGSDEKGKPIKTYNELLEIKLRKILSKYIELGEEYDELLYELLDCIESKK